MAASGYTPILSYGSTTASAVPLAANLTTSASGVELAVNALDGKLFYKDAGGTVQVLGVKMPSGILPIANGGTNSSSTPTAGALAYGTGTAYGFTAAGSSGQVLTSAGSGTPTWTSLSSIGVTTFSAGTTGFTPSTATSGAVTLAGTLATTNGGTGLTSFTANGVVYASSTSALATGSALTFDGTNFTAGTNAFVADAGVYAFGDSTCFINGVKGGSGYQLFRVAGSEQMRLTSTGLGIGTSSPENLLQVAARFGVSSSGVTRWGQIITASGRANSGYLTWDTGLVAVGTEGATALRFDTNSTERMRLDSSGNLGIGTSSPGTKLQVYGGYISQTNGTVTTYLGFDGTGSLVGTTTNNYFRFITNNNEVARFDTSGNLGIGTSSPGAKLDVNGAALSRLGSGGVALCGDASPDLGFVGYNYYNVSGTETVPQTIRSSWRHRFGNGATNVWSVGYRAGSAAVSAWTEYLTLDSSGNLGLGVTPSAWGSAFKAMQIGTGGAVWGSTSATEVNIGGNARVDANNAQYDYINTGAASQYQQSAGTHVWKIAPSGTAGNAITFTQAMTLDASGNLGLGVTGPAVYTVGSRLLQIDGGANATELKLTNNTTGNAGGDGTLLQLNGLAAYFWNLENSFLSFGTNNAERARIDDSGNLLVGTTSGANARLRVDYSGQSYGLRVGTTSTSGTAMQFVYEPSAQVGTITTTTTATAYNTSSDYRLKNTIAPMTGALAKVAALKPVTYKWKADGSDGEGFIAHELAEVVPQCVTGEKDAVDAEGKPLYQGIDTSFLVATLTAAIQEQQAQIEALTARLAAAGIA